MQEQRAAKIQARERSTAALILQNATPDIDPATIHDVWRLIERGREIARRRIPRLRSHSCARVADQILTGVLGSQRSGDDDKTEHEATQRHVVICAVRREAVNPLNRSAHPQSFESGATWRMARRN